MTNQSENKTVTITMVILFYQITKGLCNEMKKTDDKPTTIQSFEPIADHNSRVLILGTMPGEESLRQQQYYAHSRNLFWSLAFQVFDKPPESDYDKKLQFLLNHHIALWDVFRSCERAGSLDSSIHKEELNDITGLLNTFPGIKYVFCNGETAWKQFCLKVLPCVKRSVFHLRLPSTSPANASIPYSTKLRQWAQIRWALENHILHQTLLKTEIGLFRILSDDRNIIRICLPGGDMPAMEQYALFSGNKPSINAAEQIKEYLSGKRKTFNIPFKAPGTPFEQKVYQALLQVPHGDTISYGRLAEKAGNGKAARAVGQIVRKNPLPLLIPCHRVVGSNGKNIGFMGIRHNPLQNTLLELEQNKE